MIFLHLLCPMEVLPNHFLLKDLIMKLLTEMAKELSKDISFESDIEAVPDKGANVSCPNCYSSMDNYGYMGSKEVMIDCCGSCMVLWIDTNELATMCFINERANKRFKHHREISKDQVKQLDRHVVQEAMYGAYMRGLRLGSILGSVF